MSNDQDGPVQNERKGKPPSNGQSKTWREILTSLEKREVELLREHFLRNIPKQLYLQMGGRNGRRLQARQAIDQGKRWDLPLDKRTVDIFDYVSAVHRMLAKFGQTIAHAEMRGSTSTEINDAKLRLITAKADREELAYHREAGELLPREFVRDGLSTISQVLRQLGDSLEREYGPEAKQLAHEALDEMRIAIHRQFGREYSPND